MQSEDKICQDLWAPKIICGSNLQKCPGHWAGRLLLAAPARDPVTQEASLGFGASSARSSHLSTDTPTAQS